MKTTTRAAGRCALLALLILPLLAAPPALAKKPKGDAPAADGALAREEAVRRSLYLAVGELQRMYEAMRLTDDLRARHQIGLRMQQVLETRVLPLADTVEKSWGTKPISCTPTDSVEKVGCVRRDVALALVYRGLGRAMEGFHLDTPRYIGCAERYFPDVRSVAIFLRRPPELADLAGSALMQVPAERVAVRELLEPVLRVDREQTSVADAATRRERARWPLETQAIPYRVLPKADRLPREARRFSGPQVSLEHLSIEPLDVRSADVGYYTEVAREELTRLFERLYLVQSKEAALCPDPRVIYLPAGTYRLYSSSERDFPQPFEVGYDGQPYMLEYFFAATGEGEAPGVRLAFYPRPGLCDGRPCEDREETRHDAPTDPPPAQ